MDVTVTIKDDAAETFEATLTGLPREVLETLALEGYKSGGLTASQVRRMLGLSTRMQVDGFLKQRGVYLEYDQEDAAQDREALNKLLPE